MVLLDLYWISLGGITDWIGDGIKTVISYPIFYPFGMAILISKDAYPYSVPVQFHFSSCSYRCSTDTNKAWTLVRFIWFSEVLDYLYLFKLCTENSRWKTRASEKTVLEQVNLPANRPLISKSVEFSENQVWLITLSIWRNTLRRLCLYMVSRMKDYIFPLGNAAKVRRKFTTCKLFAHFFAFFTYFTAVFFRFSHF